MKIALIGPGIISIPPIGWGAVEILIWDYYIALKSLNHDVDIINPIRSNDRESSDSNSIYIKKLIDIINLGEYDFVHVHYDVHYHILDKLNCKKIAITSHYPYIDNFKKHKIDGYENVFNFLIKNNKYLNFVLADKDIKAFISKGANPDYIFKLKNGIKSDEFYFYSNPIYFDKSIYLGKIEIRKKQYLYQNINNIDFIGPNNNKKINNYKGEWCREDVHKNLGKYANLILLSEGEADPLVVKEALVAGLGVVISNKSGENLENKDFIDIIPDNKLKNLKYVEEVITKNREKSLKLREEIRNFGINNFDIKKIVIEYLIYIIKF